MPTLEELLKLAAKAARRPARARTAPLWPMPTDPGLLPDMIQTGRYPDEAHTIEQKIQAVYDARTAAIWDYLALPVAGRVPGPLPWAACPPEIWDPDGLLDGEHHDGWATTHPAFDYYPSPTGGLQHRVTISGGRFVRHCIAASLLPVAPC